MYVDFSALSPSKRYFALTQTLVPRPVAWVLSDSGDGVHNLAPFSYFSAVCSDPALIMISIGKKPTGEEKDTRLNIRERRDFVVHIAHPQQAEAMTASSATLAHGLSEVAELGLETTAFEGFRLPRLADCRVAYACELYEYREIGPAQQAMILGEVKHLYVADQAVAQDEKGRTRYVAEAIDGLGRLGGNDYTTMGETLSVQRPA